MKKGEVVKTLEFGVEEAILFAIIILNFLDAFEIIGSDLDYIKKIISWTALGILVYKTSPSKLFVGYQRKTMDLLLIAAYFLMILKNLISYAYVGILNASSFLKPFYSFLISNATQIEITGLYMGLFLIIVVCFNLSLRTPLKAPSILHLMRADKVKHDVKTFFMHFFALIFIAFGFFLVFFNLIMEWLAIAIDAPLLMIGLVSYILILTKHKHMFSPGSFLRKFGDFGSDFYKGVLEHLRYKRAFLRVVNGMLILHILTDMLTFVWHHLFGIGDQLYFGFMNLHPTFYQLLVADYSISGLSIIIHFANIIALVFLMVVPIFMWLSAYFHKKIELNNQLLILFCFSIFMLFLNPTYALSAFSNQMIYGVDIIGSSVTQFQYMPFSIAIFIAIALTVFLAMYKKHFMIKLMIIVSKLFFVTYVATYFYSIAQYYIKTISFLLPYNWFLSIILIIFFGITSLFYVVGTTSFIIDSADHLEEKVHKKLTKHKPNV